MVLSASLSAPISSNDGRQLMRDPKSTFERCFGQSEYLVNRPSQIDNEFIRVILCQSTEHAIEKVPSIEELSGASEKTEQWEVTRHELSMRRNYEIWWLKLPPHTDK